MVVGMIYEKVVRATNSYEEQTSSTGTLKHTVKHHNNISSFQESIVSGSAEIEHPPSSESDRNEGSFSDVEELADYLKLEIREGT